jgi:O-antigen/teichoic acid export membrane protein
MKRLANLINLSKFTKESFLILFLKVGGRFIAYILVLLIAHKYGADTMGAFALSTTLVIVLSIIGRFGSDLALLKFAGELSSTDRGYEIKGVHRKILFMFIPFCFFLSILLFLASEYLAVHVFKNDSLAFDFKFISLAIVPMAIIGINSEGLRGLKKTREYAFLSDIGVPLFSTIFLAISLLFIRENHMPIIAYGASVFLVFFLSQFIWNKRSHPEPALLNRLPDKDNIDTRTIFNVSLSMLIATSSMLIISSTDILILGMFRSKADVGIYNVASRWAKLTSLPLMAIIAVTAPKISASYARQDLILLKDTITKASMLIFWTSFPIILIFLTFPTFMMGIFGQEFRSGAYALVMLGIGEFINAIAGSAGFILQMAGREVILRNIMIFTCIINIGLNVILIPIYGLNGAAFTSMITMAFMNITSVVYVRIYTNINPLYFPWLKNRKITK